MSALLAVRGLNKSFGSVVAANNIEVEIAAGEIVGIIGANGAGKTTFVNLVTGYLTPTSGTIEFLGRDITALPPRDIIAAGISRSFQVPQVFSTASVFDNLLIACGIASGARLPLWRPLRRPDLVAQAEALVQRFGLAEYRDQGAQLLPQGVRKLLDIAMALVRAPKLLLLDEPTSGISAEEKFAIMELIMTALRRERIAVLFIEHDMDIIARHAARVLAFVDGGIIAEGSPSQVLADPQVRRSITGEHVPVGGGGAMSLALDSLDVAIGASTIIRGARLDVPAGTVAGLIGRNGAGKTTLLRAIMGILPARSGAIRFDERDLTAAPAYARARAGIGYMPEDRKLVPDFSVRDNILLPLWATGRRDEARLGAIYALMPELEPLAARRANQLSGGQQKMVALARAMMAGTKLLLLDEPSEGLAPALARRIGEVLAKLRGSGLAVLMAESNDTHLGELFDTAFVIERGSVARRA